MATISKQAKIQYLLELDQEEVNVLHDLLCDTVAGNMDGPRGIIDKVTNALGEAVDENHPAIEAKCRECCKSATTMLSWE